MKINYKSLFFYLLGIITVSFVSFKVGNSYNEVKPVKPKSTAILNQTVFDDEWKNYIKQGYQVHSISALNNGHTVIVLVKY